MGETCERQNFYIREAMMRGARLQDDGRVYIRIFCDGTFCFGQEAARLLHNAGCQNLTIESKIVSPNPRFPKWMTCLFDVSGTHPVWPDEMPESKYEESQIHQFLVSDVYREALEKRLMGFMN